MSFNNFSILLVADYHNINIQSIFNEFTCAGYKVDQCELLDQLEVMLNGKDYNLVLLEAAAGVKNSTEPVCDRRVSGLQIGVPILLCQKKNFILLFTSFSYYWYMRHFSKLVNNMDRELCLGYFEPGRTQVKEIVQMVQRFQ